MEAMQRKWYLVEMLGSGQRAIETGLDYSTMMKKVQCDEMIEVYRQVVAQASQVGPTEVRVNFMKFDDVAYMSKVAIRPFATMIAGRAILSVVPVAEESDTWREVRRKILGDTTLIAPPKTLAFPERQP